LVAAFAPLFLRRRHFKQRVALIVKEVPMSLPRLVLTLVLIAVVLVPATAIAVRAFPLEGSAVPAAPDQIKVGGKVMQKKLVHKVAPVYPPLAKQAQIQGTVRLQAVVAPDGSIKDLQVISGHPLLIPPSEEAVRQWRYEPTLLNGNPVEVVTQIDINYTLSETKEGIPVILGGQQPAAPPLDFLIPNPTFQTQPAPGVQRLRVSGNVQQQKLEHTAPAVWPPPAQQAQVKGVARFNALIGTDGMVKEIQIVSGHPLLIPAAREALEQYRYQPTLLNGQPVEVVAQVNIPVPPDYEAPAAELLGFKPSGDITPPMLVRKVEPQYTQEAKDAKLEGTLLAAVTVDEQGKVSDVLIVRGLGLGLDEKAVEALRQWEFQPGQKDGQPVKIRATVEINFRLM
jgi:TonB family protein